MALSLFAVRCVPRARGFTLPELLTAVLVAAVLAAAAAPNFRPLLLNQRVKTASFELFIALNYARSEAIKRGTTVSLVPSGPGWEYGWRIIDGNDQVLKIQSELSGALQVNGPDKLVYERDGRLSQLGASARFSIAVASEAPAGVHGRCIRVDLSGRPNSREGACP